MEIFMLGKVWFQSAKSKIIMLQLTFSERQVTEVKIQMVNNLKIFYFISYEEQKYNGNFFHVLNN